MEAALSAVPRPARCATPLPTIRVLQQGGHTAGKAAAPPCPSAAMCSVCTSRAKDAIPAADISSLQGCALVMGGFLPTHSCQDTAQNRQPLTHPHLFLLITATVSLSSLLCPEPHISLSHPLQM